MANRVGPAKQVDAVVKVLILAQPVTGRTTIAEWTKPRRVYSRRWVMLAIVFLLNLTSGCLWVTFAPISHAAATFYATSESTINGLSLIFMAAFVPCGLLAQWALDNHGLRKSLVNASIVNALGAWLRFLSTYWTTSAHARLGLVFAGQALAAFAQPVILDCPTLLATSWFGPTERATANTIMSVSNPIGVAIGSVVAPLMVSDTGAGMATMLLVMSLAPTVAAVLAVAFLQNHPPSAPSASAEHQSDHFMQGLRKLRHNRPYWVLCMAFGIGVGIVSALTTLMGQIANSQGYSSDEAGLFSAAIIGVGLVGAGLFGYIVDRTKRFIPILRACSVASAICLLFFAGFLAPSSFSQQMVPLAFLGFFVFANLPTSLELAVEATFPVSAGTSAGFMWMAGQVWGIVLILVADPLRGSLRCFPTMSLMPADYACPYTVNGSTVVEAYADMRAACWFLAGAALVSTFATLFVATNYKRLEFERAEQPDGAEDAASNSNLGTPTIQRQQSGHVSILHAVATDLLISD